MTISTIINVLEDVAPPFLQEDYDNTGLITGDKNCECTGAIISLDATEEVIQEALDNNCNLVISHHPIIFSGLKKINGKNYVEKAIITAIKNDIAIYAIHTNLDNVIGGVNGKMAEKLGLTNCHILAPKENLLQKLVVYVPADHKEIIREALFAAGAGHIGNYSECSFEAEGLGTYKAGKDADPFAGKIGKRHTEKEVRLEVIFPRWLQQKIIKAMLAVHPYEEVAYDLYALSGSFSQAGSGITGELREAINEKDFLLFIKNTFNLSLVRHTAFTAKQIKRVALCGGAGSFLIKAAKRAGADVYITADVKYHEFFEAEGQILLADIGHYESEQFTTDLLFDILRNKFPNFAVRKTDVNTNPVSYF